MQRIDDDAFGNSGNSETYVPLRGQPSTPVPDAQTWNERKWKATSIFERLFKRTNVSVKSRAETIPVSFSSKETTATLISHYGVRILDAVNIDGVPLLCDAIVQQQPDSAELLLDFARDHGRFVEIESGRCPTLDWAIKKRSVDVAQFVLDYLTERRLSVNESCTILTNYLIPLIEKFSNLMAEYLEKDKLVFEYGRFNVPYSLFEKNGRRPIAMTTNEALEDWTVMDSEAAKDFWMRNSEEHAAEMAKTSDLQVDVIAKFFCIDQQSVRKSISNNTVSIKAMPVAMFGCKHVLRMLSKSNLPLNVFKSETVKTFANWMFYSLYNRFWFLLIVDVLTAGLFSFFAVSYGSPGKESSWLHGTPLSFSEDPWFSLLLIILSFVLPLMTLMIRDSKIKIFNTLVSFALTLHAFQSEHQNQFSAFLTSIGCIFCWLLVVEDLMPFDKIGPFVSMAKYSIKEVLPFTGLGASVLVGFSFAFRALLIQKFYEVAGNETDITDATNRGGSPSCSGGGDNADQDFSSFFHVLKLLFQAAIGNFEERVFRSTDSFIGRWRSLLFNGFIFVGGVVLLSLLIAILSETYNRVRLTEKEELVKCRAEMAGTTLRCIAHRILRPDDRSRRDDSDHEYERSVSLRFQVRMNSVFHKFRLRALDRQKYFHYLVRATKTDEERSKEESNDVLDRIANLNECLQQFQESMQTAQAQNSQASQETMQNVQTQIHHLDERMKMMEINIARVLEKLTNSLLRQSELCRCIVHANFSFLIIIFSKGNLNEGSVSAILKWQYGFADSYGWSDDIAASSDFLDYLCTKRVFLRTLCFCGMQRS